MSHTYHCDVCKREITTADNLPSPYMKAQLDNLEVVFHFTGPSNGLGWPIDICATCLRVATKQAKWIDPHESESE